MLDLIISSAVQLIIMSLIPFIWWLVTARKKESFFKWLGFHGFKEKPLKILLYCALLGLGATAVMYFIMPIVMGDTPTATTQFGGRGFAALPEILIYAVIQTSLSEEIFFRGFLGKRLISKLGFTAGNTIQAFLFGLMHGVLFFVAVGWWQALVLIIVTGAIGWAQGYINEKRADGSIFPSWLCHAVMNIASALAAAL